MYISIYKVYFILQNKLDKVVELVGGGSVNNRAKAHQIGTFTHPPKSWNYEREGYVTEIKQV